MFPKRKYSYGIPPMSEIIEVSSSIVDESTPDGIKKKVKFEEFDPRSEEALLRLPKPEEYTLEMLIASGTPLEQVPNLSNLLAPRIAADPVVVASIETSVNAMLDKLEAESVAKVEKSNVINFED